MTAALAIAVWLESSVADEGFTHVRSTVAYVRALIREGYERSPGFRDLVDTLQRSNAIVLVQPGSCADGRIRSCLVSIHGSRAERQIRIKIDPAHTIRDGLIATIGHELQHAVEIAEHPDVFDGETAQRLFRRIGIGQCHEGLWNECETTRALETERRVLDELLHRAK
jgi:hypothetical protein